MGYNKKSKEELEPKITRLNGKYKRLSEAESITGISRETLMYRLKQYQETTGDIILYQENEKTKLIEPYTGSKSLVFLDWDKISTRIPSLIESEVIKQMLDRIQKMEDDLRICKEIFYSRGYLRREII